MKINLAEHKSMLFLMFSFFYVSGFFVFGQEIDKDDFKKKALGGQGRWSKTMQKVTATGTLNHPGFTGGKPLQIKLHVDGDRRCVEIYNDDWKNSEGEDFCVIKVFTPEYRFELSQTTPDSHFNIIVATDKFTESEKVKLRLVQSLLFDGFLFAPITVDKYSAKEILTEQNDWKISEIKSISEQGDQLNTFHISLEPKQIAEHIANLSFTTSGDSDYGISGYRVDHESMGKRSNFKTLTKIEYLDQATDGIRLFQVTRLVTQITNGISNTSNESVVFDSIKKGCRSDVFLLSNYINAPDPFVRRNDQKLRYILIAIGAAMAIGIFVFWRRKNS
jgi:hypothetical protein